MHTVSIHLHQISKKFYQHFLYKNLSLQILPKDKLVIIGQNGSGKSTLLKIIMGLISPTSGKIEYKLEEKNIAPAHWHQYISVAAPYMSLIEKFSVKELLEHLWYYRAYQVDKYTLLELLELRTHLNKPIQYFSSGMKQKTKLMLAIADKAPILLLDEPTSNLDAQNVEWYKKMIETFAMHKTIIVFSNSQPQEYFFCQKTYHLSQ